MGEPDLSRLLLEASRVLGAEIVVGLQERGFPDARPGHAALFMHIDRRWGTRLTDLARVVGAVGIAVFIEVAGGLLRAQRDVAAQGGHLKVD